jgi:replication-associated recombination protein RarA
LAAAAAMQAAHFVGMPEGNLALAEAAVYSGWPAGATTCLPTRAWKRASAPAVSKPVARKRIEPQRHKEHKDHKEDFRLLSQKCKGAEEQR